MSKLAQRLGLPRYQADAHYRAALRAFVERDLEKAKAMLQPALDLLPSHAEYHAVLGFFLLEDKMQAAAMDAFERALALDPYDMLANYGRGMAAYRAKDWQAAESRFTDALAAQPQRAETLYYLAMVNHRLGRNAQALRWMSSAAAAFAKADDSRQSQCQAWTREFQKLLDSI